MKDAIKKPHLCWLKQDITHSLEQKTALYVGLYLLEDSGAGEESNMASLVFPRGREGLHKHKHKNKNKHKHNVSDTILSAVQTESEHDSGKSLKHKGLPIKKKKTTHS